MYKIYLSYEDDSQNMMNIDVTLHDHYFPHSTEEEVRDVLKKAVASLIQKEVDEGLVIDYFWLKFTEGWNEPAGGAIGFPYPPEDPEE